MTKPKILIYDIETSLVEATVRGFLNTKYDVRLKFDEINSQQKVHCIGYKWLGEKKAHVISVHDFPKRFKKDHMDDSQVIKEFQKILKQADAVIGHNIKGYDNKHVMTRILLNGAEPMIMPHPIDTLLLSRKNFNLTSHKLDSLARELGLDVRKSPMSRRDWDECFEGDIKAFKKMAKYCKQDIQVTEKVYNALLPYVQGHPNVARIMGATAKQAKGICPICNHDKNIKAGTRGTTVGIKQLRRCKNCGKVFEAETKK